MKGLFTSLSFKILGECRDESRAYGSFANEAPEQVRNSKGDDKRVGFYPGPKKRRDPLYAYETRYTANERYDGYQGGGPDEAAVLGHACYTNSQSDLRETGTVG